jgi:hypothetical protein
MHRSDTLAIVSAVLVAVIPGCGSSETITPRPDGSPARDAAVAADAAAPPADGAPVDHDASSPPPDAAAADASGCTLGERYCEPYGIFVCNGTSFNIGEACYSGCVEDPEPRCVYVIPSNVGAAGIGGEIDWAPRSSIGDSIFDTDTCSGAGAPAGEIRAQEGGGPPVCLVRVRRFSLIDDMTVIGSRPLVISAMQDAQIVGTLTVGSFLGGTAGAGANSGSLGGASGTSGAASASSGGGGGGHCGAGGNGGSGTDASTTVDGAVGGEARAAGWTLEPLVGGSSGGDGGGEGGSGGDGGGAIQITAQSEISFNGTIVASGAGGSGGVLGSDAGGGGGGGSGGSILLEAPFIRGILNADLRGGGGGAGACAATSTPGPAGQDGLRGGGGAVSPGCGGATMHGGDGGDGTMSGGLDGESGADVTFGGNGGGGGGGAGCFFTRGTMSGIFDVQGESATGPLRTE